MDLPLEAGGVPTVARRALVLSPPRALFPFDQRNARGNFFLSRLLLSPRDFL
jgi:hypothetical protein